MKQLTSNDDIKQLGTILSFWAHPDDETFFCAGIMATAIQNGQRVICVTATRGEEGVQDENRWPREKLGEIRTKELSDALEILDITEHFFLDYRDRTLKNVTLEEGVGKVLKFIDFCQPETILTFGPEGITGHPDHQTVSGWVKTAVQQLEHPPCVYHAVEPRERYEKYMKQADEQFDIFFNIDEPPLKDANECDLYFLCSPDLCSKKCEALKAMPSQTERIVKSVDGATLREMFKPESFVEAK